MKKTILFIALTFSCLFCLPGFGQDNPCPRPASPSPYSRETICHLRSRDNVASIQPISITRTNPATRTAETLNFRVATNGTANPFVNMPDMSYVDIIRKIRLTLERLPTSHLRALQPVRFLVGRPTSGGGANPCRDANGNFTECSTICLSYECFRAQTENGPFTIGERTITGNAGSWDEGNQCHLTVLHEIGHFMNYHFRIYDALTTAQKEDCRTCARNPNCYGPHKTLGPDEVIAQSYAYYFQQKTWEQILSAVEPLVQNQTCQPNSPGNPCGQPRPRGTLLTVARRAYLTNSPAWQNWW